jgi:uncharacterized protein (DUF1330 family)
MTVKLIGLIKLIDPAALDEYRSQVGATVEKFGGRVTQRASVAKTFWNELGGNEFEDLDAFVELEFSNLADAARWATSDDYRALLELRSRAMKLTLFAIE